MVERKGKEVVRFRLENEMVSWNVRDIKGIFLPIAGFGTKQANTFCKHGSNPKISETQKFSRAVKRVCRFISAASRLNRGKALQVDDYYYFEVVISRDLTTILSGYFERYASNKPKNLANLWLSSVMLHGKFPIWFFRFLFGYHLKWISDFPILTFPERNNAYLRKNRIFAPQWFARLKGNAVKSGDSSRCCKLRNRAGTAPATGPAADREGFSAQ